MKICGVSGMIISWRSTMRSVVFPFEIFQMIYDFADIETKVKMGRVFGTRCFWNRRVDVSASLERGLGRTLEYRINRYHTIVEIHRRRRDSTEFEL
jgi:hypothetical protein